jgi:hypothetical protein
MRSLLVFASIAVAVSLDASEVMFPAPLHLTREVSDPIRGTTGQVEEYAHGNRIVSIAGQRTAIADFEKNTLTVIDFEANTYSITAFDDLAKAGPRAARATAREEVKIEEETTKVVASRTCDVIAARRGNRGMRIAVDRQLMLRRSAVEALIGVGHPYPADDLATALLERGRRSGRRAVTQSAAAIDELPLPLEQTTTIDLGGETIEIRNQVTRVGSELPPLERLSIPTGATLIESSAVTARRMLDELDRLPAGN